MNNTEPKKIHSGSVNSARRKLLKLGVYSAPAILFLGRVTTAKASGGSTSSKTRKNGKDCNIFKQIISFGQWC
ncbi:hypothetical protein HRbin37_00984 [bacterium HR37]|nr:hypothetical protein HRbin37_00984 [bacterium HR37]